MNRTVVFLVGAVIVVAFGVGGYYAVDYYTKDHTPAVQAGPAPTPLTWEEMEKLQARGPDAHEEIPRLLQCFATSDEAVRVQAAETLGKIGPKAVEPVREKLK